MYTKIEALDAPEQECPRCHKVTHLYSGGSKGREPVQACYDCLRIDPVALEQHGWALKEELSKSEEEVGYLRRELQLARMGREELLDLLALERARLNFLSMDGTASVAGYVTVHIGADFKPDQVCRPNIRQAVDALAGQHDPDWVHHMLAWGVVQSYEDMNKPDHYNESYGPSTPHVPRLLGEDGELVGWSPQADGYTPPTTESA